MVPSSREFGSFTVSSVLGSPCPSSKVPASSYVVRKSKPKIPEGPVQAGHHRGLSSRELNCQEQPSSLIDPDPESSSAQRPTILTKLSTLSGQCTTAMVFTEMGSPKSKGCKHGKQYPLGGPQEAPMVATSVSSPSSKLPSLHHHHYRYHHYTVTVSIVIITIT